MTTAGTSRNEMIRVQGLIKQFERVTAVDDVDLSVMAKEVVGLVGINGAGKTTLLRMLAGILEPTRGTITIAGHPVAAGTVEARRALSFVPDTPTLFEPLTVFEHLLFVAELYQVSDPLPMIDTLLDEFELSGKRHTPAGSLSRGMRQKVSICCAFLHDPAVLLLDEPLTGLDPLGRKRMCDAITARAAQGTAVIISSHQLEIIERLSCRFVIIHEGRIRLSGTLEEVRQGMGSLEDVFLQATEESES